MPEELEIYWIEILTDVEPRKNATVNGAVPMVVRGLRRGRGLETDTEWGRACRAMTTF